MDRKSYLCLLALLKEIILSLFLVTLLPSKVLVTRNLINLLLINTRQINFLGGGDNVAGVDAAERNTVDFEGAGNEENTLLEVLQQDDALATETTSEEDENGAGGEGWSGSRGANGFADLEQLLVVDLGNLRVFDC
jgi:hypothetical protein